MSRPWARRAGSQQSSTGSAPCTARPPGQPRPQPGPARPRRSSPARLLQHKPAAPARSTASRAFPALGEPQRPRRRAAPTHPTPPGPARPARATAPGGAPRGTLGVVVRAAQPRPAAETPGREGDRRDGYGPRACKPLAFARGGERPRPQCGRRIRSLRAETGRAPQRPTPHLEER